MIETFPPGGWTCLLLPQLLSDGNLEAAIGCFARDACLLTPDATDIHGRGRIGAVLAQFVARHPRIDVAPRSILVAGEVAVAREHWTISTDGVEGSRFEQHSTPTLIMRRSAGRWKLAIVAPWG